MDEIKTLNREMKKLRRMLEIICERVGLDMETIEKEASRIECIDCGMICNEKCFCGCGKLACSCFTIFIGDHYFMPTKYFYSLECMERMGCRSDTSCFVKEELDDFIKRWKAQNC